MGKTSLADLAAAGRDVEIRGASVTVTGVSARGLASLFRRFPELVSAVTGKGLDLSSLADLGPDVLCAVIAAGCGAPGDEAAEDAADRLSLSEQLSLVEAVVGETFGGDPEAFLARLGSLAAGAGVRVETPTTAG